MWVPVSYNLRSLIERRGRTALTLVGIAAVVSVYIVMNSVSGQMRSLFRGTGAPDEILVMQAGSVNPELSSVSRSSSGWLGTQDGVAQGASGPLVSPELSLASRLEKSLPADVMLRGVEPIALSFYREVKVAEGAPPSSGKKVIVGEKLARAEHLKVGDEVVFEGSTWGVAGIFSAAGAVYEQEIWTDLEDLAAAARRPGPSHFTVRATSRDAAKALVAHVNDQHAEPLQALTAEAAYARIGGMSIWMSALGQFIAVVIALGAVFGGMNTMFSAVAHRRREIGILRTVGYRPAAILASFLFESLLIGLAGGLLGAALSFGVARLPLEIPFLIENDVGIGAGNIVAGLLLAVGVAVLGGFLPALSAARMQVIDALR
jgi:putative ABC transport system permease protein